MLPKIYKSDADIRKHQINTLKIFNDNVSEICEGLEYQVSFQAGRNELNLNVSLTKEFPNEKPLIKVAPIVVHPWVNNEGEVTSAPGLLNFTKHSDLGRVVQAIIREFERTPPPLASDGPRSNLTSPTQPARDSERSSPIYGAGNSFTSPSTQHSIAFPNLANLSIEELEFLNNNIEKQELFLNETSSIKEQNKVLDELILQAEELAESNLSKQKQLTELQTNVNQRIEEVTKLAFENERLHVKYLDMSSKYSPFNIKEQLRLAAEKAEVESDRIAEEFLNGEVDVDKFVIRYNQTRALCQTRKTKEEKLTHQLEKLEKAGF